MKKTCRTRLEFSGGMFLHWRFGLRHGTYGHGDRSWFEPLEARTLLSGNPVQVTTTTSVVTISAEQTKALGFYSPQQDLAINKDGVSLVAFQNTTTQTLMGQLYAADGTPIGTNLNLSDVGKLTGFTDAVSVAAAPSGNLFVAWTNFNGVDKDIDVRQVSPDGTLGNAITVNTITAGDQVSPSLAIAPGGDVSVAWVGPSGNTLNAEVLCRQFDSGLNPLSNDLICSNDTTAFDSAPQVAYGGDGVTAWVSWSQNDIVNNLQRVTIPVRQIDGTHNLVGAAPTPVIFDNNVGNFYQASRLVGLPGGGVRVAALCNVFDSSSFAFEKSFVAYRDVSVGLTVGAPTTIFQTSGANNQIGSFDFDPTGSGAGLAILNLGLHTATGTFFDGSAGLTAFSIDAGGTVHGPFSISTQPAFDPAIGIGPNGTGYVTWNTPGSTDATTNLVGQGILIGTGDVNGDGSVDITGTAALNPGSGTIIVPGDKISLKFTLHDGSKPAGPALYDENTFYRVSIVPSIDLLPLSQETTIYQKTFQGSITPDKDSVFQFNAFVPPGLANGTYNIIVDVELGNPNMHLNGDNNILVVPTTLDLSNSFGDVPGHMVNGKPAPVTNFPVVDGSGTTGFIQVGPDAAGTVTQGVDGPSVTITSLGKSGKVKIGSKSKSEHITFDDINIFAEAVTVDADGVDLVGNMTTQRVTTVMLGNVKDQHLITIGGTASDTPVTITLGEVANTILSSGAPIKSLTATEWIDDDATRDTITAPWIGTLTIKGSKTAGALSAGNFEADVLLSDTTQKLALTKVNVAGTVEGADFIVAGSIGSFTAGAMDNSVVAAGFTGTATTLAPGLPSTFAFTKSIASVTIKDVAGDNNGFINSLIYAANLGTITLKDVQTNNTGTPFGIAADTLKSYTRKDATGKTSIKKLSKLTMLIADADAVGDLVVTIV